MNKIRELRENKKMTQDKLGKLVGVGRSTVAKWESGENLPRARQLISLANVFGVKVDALLRL
ncbi:MAG: helix-turn-helix domain-containing protein [Selenomonas bovis]|nr:helix-turn-helix domain-containing protein [Selenomonas bovis]